MKLCEMQNITFQVLKQDRLGGLKNLVAAWNNLRGEPLGMSSYPLIAQIEPTLYCNLKCEMCVNPLGKRTRRHMSLDEFRRVVESLKFVRKLSLVGAGEPLLNPDLFGMIRYAKSKGIHTGFATNGMLLDDSVCGRIVESGVDWVNISVDSADSAKFKSIRKGADLGVLRKNIKRLVRIKGKKNLPELSIWFVIMRDNFSELPRVIELSKDAGIRIVSAQMEHSWNDDSLREKMALFPREDFMKEVKEMLKKAEETALAKGVKFGYVNVPDTGTKRSCKWPWKSCYITAEGFVTPCCLQGSDPGVMNFGNILKEDFDQIWNGFGYRKFREMLKSDKLPSICKGCTSYYGKIRI